MVVQDDNTEAVTRALEAGAALTKIFENGVASGAISIEDMFDTSYVEIAGTNPVQYRTKMLDWADRALPPFQEAFLAKDKRMAFYAMIDTTVICLFITRSIRTLSGRATSPGIPPTAATAASSTIRPGLPPGATSAPI